MRVAIARAGLAGRSCAKYLTDAGHAPIVLDSQMLGGMVAAWHQGDDWYKELHALGSSPDLLPLGKAKPTKLLKHHVVRTSRSVDQTILKRQDYPQIQQTPVHNFCLSKSYTMQPYLGSMEGAVLSGKLTKLEEAPSLYGGVSLTAQAITAHQSAPNSLQMQNIQPATNAATA